MIPWWDKIGRNENHSLNLFSANREEWIFNIKITRKYYQNEGVSVNNAILWTWHEIFHSLSHT